MSPRLDTTTVTTLARITGWTGVTEAIFTARYYSTLVGIRQVNRLLQEQAPDVLDRTGFVESIDLLSAAPAHAQQRVLRHPSTAFWVDVAWDLIRRRAHLRFPEVHLVPHLREFSRFAVAASLLSGRGRLDATVRADPYGRIALPGTGTSIQPPDTQPCHRVRLHIHDGTLTVGPSDARPPRLPVPGLANGIELNHLDHDLRLDGRTAYTFAELGPDEARRWLDELNRHFSTIGEVSPSTVEELTGGIVAFVPVLSPAAHLHVSGSFQEAPGLIALALGDRLATIEAIVHEYGHQKLNALLMLDRLITNNTGEAVHYSPWRDDPRPLSGLLHAVYSFVTVIDFYHQMLDSPEASGFAAADITARAYRVMRQVGSGLDELRTHATFSQLGAAFVQAVAEHIDRCRRDFPLPPVEVRRELDARHEEHRSTWLARHGRVRSFTAEPPVDADLPASPTAAERATLQALGLPESWRLGWIARRWYPGDSLLDAVRARDVNAGPDLPDSAVGESAITDLAAAHLAYTRDDYATAALRYAACVGQDPHSPYYWHCYAFTLRHLGRHDEALYILTHTSELMARAEPPEPGADVRVRMREPEWGLAVPDDAAAGAVTTPLAVPLPAAATAAVRESRYWDFVEATRSGAQLPALIALTHGLKPAMDLWVPPDGWPAMTRLVKELGLQLHVDAYFDRYHRELTEVPPDQLTTTRAVFAPALRPGTEAHVFLAVDRAALDQVVGAGWYPLIIDGHVVNKHRADHDKFGNALGYPPCCQEFFRLRNNWNEDNTYYAALRNTRGEPSILCNPFLRHTAYGLISYMPCSYTCSATSDLAGKLRTVIRHELPTYMDAIEQELTRTVLCVSELRMYAFDGELVEHVGDTVSIRYAGVRSLYPVEDKDSTGDLLRAGDHCIVDGEVIHVHRAQAYVGSYQTRGDRHGPQCPFVISFTH